MLGHVIDAQRELFELLEQRRVREQTLIIGASESGRWEWVYEPEGEAERIAELRATLRAFEAVRWRH